MGYTRRSGGGRTYKGAHVFEHWYRENQVYFVTARCRDQVRAFAHEKAKGVFWERFEHYAQQHGFVPFVTTLLDNHYHTLGYAKPGCFLGRMMQQIHGSVAKLVNDLLPVRQTPFWRDTSGRDYFDGCIRDEKQCRLAYRYTQMQAVRAGIVRDWRDYAHTRVNVDLDRAVKRALELGAFMHGVPYKRYEK